MIMYVIMPNVIGMLVLVMLMFTLHTPVTNVPPLVPMDGKTIGSVTQDVTIPLVIGMMVLVILKLTPPSPLTNVPPDAPITGKEIITVMNLATTLHVIGIMVTVEELLNHHMKNG